MATSLDMIITDVLAPLEIADLYRRTGNISRQDRIP